jgi:periodic tryptophan protein 1
VNITGLKMAAITSLAWVPCGCARSKPDKLKVTVNEIVEPDAEKEVTASHEIKNDKGSIERKSKKLENGDDDSDDDDKDDGNDKSDDDNYHMSDYDDEEENDKNALSIENIAVGESQDPYLVGQTDSDSDPDDEVLASDNLLVLGKLHGEYSTLEVHVHAKDRSLYCHHDYILPSVPLAIEWLGFDPGDNCKGNIAAVGYVNTDIELWDLDVMNAVEPIVVLPGIPKKGKKKQKRHKVEESLGHTDAVLALAWNKQYEHVLASGSADSKIILWDLQEAKAVSSFEQHSDKVQTIAWHLNEQQTLLSGSADKSAIVYDCRCPADVHKRWTVKSEIEQVVWNTSKPFLFYAGTSSGRLYTFDIRTEEPLSKIKAHDDAVTGLCMGPCSDEKSYLYTASADKTVKLWDIGGEKPVPRSSYDGKLGKIFCARVNPDDSSLIAMGGEREFRIRTFNV